MIDIDDPPRAENSSEKSQVCGRAIDKKKTGVCAYNYTHHRCGLMIACIAPYVRKAVLKR